MCFMNFLNQIFFLCPYLGFYLKRINNSQNSILCCFNCKYNDSDKRVEEGDKEEETRSKNHYHIIKQESTTTQKIELNDDDDDDNGRVELKQNNQEIKKERKTFTTISETVSFKTSTHLIEFFLFNKIFRVIILIFFIIYLVFNIIICTRIKVDIPVLQIIPEQSFLYKHMQLHQQYFMLGPMVMLVFKKPFNYWENETRIKVRDFIDDIKNLNDMNHLLELNWIKYIEIAEENNCLYESKECFVKAIINNILPIETFVDDINLYDNKTEQDTNTSYLSKNRKKFDSTSNYFINSSRIYVQFKSFFGSQSELNTWQTIHYLAYEKYKFAKDDLIVFTFIQQVFEQMSEIKYEFFFITLIAIDFIILIKFLYICQLRFIYVHLILVTSLLLSIISFLNLFQIQFNIISLLNYLIVPAIVIEYLSSIDYIYLHCKYKNKANCGGELCALTNDEESGISSSLSSERSSITEIKGDNKYDIIKYLFKINLNTNSILIIILLASFLILHNCMTYNFKVFFKIFLSILINLFLHINFFYPALLIFFDNKRQVNKKEKIMEENQNRTIIDK
jgi:hypothetical protein